MEDGPLGEGERGPESQRKEVDFLRKRVDLLRTLGPSPSAKQGKVGETVDPEDGPEERHNWKGLLSRTPTERTGTLPSVSPVRRTTHTHTVDFGFIQDEN